MLLSPSFLIVWTLSIACLLSSTDVMGEAQDLVQYRSGSDIADADVVTVRSLSIHLHFLESVRHAQSNICVLPVFD